MDVAASSPSYPERGGKQVDHHLIKDIIALGIFSLGINTKSWVSFVILIWRIRQESEQMKDNESVYTVFWGQ